MLQGTEIKTRTLFIALVLFSFASCKKDNATIPAPEMIYTDLMDRAVKHNLPAIFIDLNRDGMKDIVFNTLAVGDPLNNLDKWQYRVDSDIETKLPVNNHEQVPMMNKAQRIPVQDFEGYQWYEGTSIILMQKNISVELPVFWTGQWLNVNKRYIPLQVKKEGKQYNGWIEISTDIQQEKIILHKAAITKEPEKEALAGH